MSTEADTLQTYLNGGNSSATAEYLRGLFFPEGSLDHFYSTGDLGGYSNFDVSEDAVEVKDLLAVFPVYQGVATIEEVRAAYFHSHENQVDADEEFNEDLRTLRAFTLELGDFNVLMVRSYNGDPVIVFQVSYNHEVVSRLANHDAKKSDRWVETDWNPEALETKQANRTVWVVVAGPYSTSVFDDEALMLEHIKEAPAGYQLIETKLNEFKRWWT